MRVEYEVNKKRMVKFLDYLYTTDKSSINGYSLVVLGYIISNKLQNYSFSVLEDLTKGDVRYKSRIESAVEDLTEFYFDLSLNVPLTDKSIGWLKIGVDFILANCKEYIVIEALKNKNVYREENKIIKEYVIENKEEFPEAYLDLML